LENSTDKKHMRLATKIAIFVLLTSLPLLAQTPERAKMKAELDDLSTVLTGVNRRQQALSLQADSLARDIQQRKRQRPSFLQERNLDAALRFSQTLADSLQLLQAREQRLDYLLRQKAEALLKILNNDIARLDERAENLKKGKKTEDREQIRHELIECRQWQRRCQEWLEQPPPAIIIYQVEAQPEDTPETLRRKADFLRDQADRLRRDVKRLDAKISDIRDETQVRRRVADLATDLSLFDPNREGVSSPARSEQAAVTFGPSERDLESGVAQTGVAEVTTINSSVPVYRDWPAQLGELSFDDLEKWRGRLEQQKKQRRAQADSLAKRAVEIEKLMGQPAGEKRQ
jgi:hypothetical protein